MEHKDKIPEEVKADVQKAIDELKAVMESEDAEAIKEKVQALQVRVRALEPESNTIIENGSSETVSIPPFESYLPNTPCSCVLHSVGVC